MTLTDQPNGAGAIASPAPRRRRAWQMLFLLAPVLVLIVTVFDWPLL